MKTDAPPASAHSCACCDEEKSSHGTPSSPTAINRRRFLAAGSGCVLGAWSGLAADKAPPVDIGTLKSFDKDGIFEEFVKDDFLVMRYQGRLFAASTTCPHMGGTLRRDPQDATRITCSLHESVFDGEGMATVGPASGGLTRLGISVNKDDRVLVDIGKQFPQEKWKDKGSYIEVK